MNFPEKFRIRQNLEIENTVIHAFSIPFRGRELQVIASVNPSGWEQVSVSLQNRNPNWDEMCHIKSLFFQDDETCIQFHPKKEDYVNLHNNCLHIWKPPVEITNFIDQYK